MPSVADLLDLGGLVSRSESLAHGHNHQDLDRPRRGLVVAAGCNSPLCCRRSKQPHAAPQQLRHSSSRLSHNDRDNDDDSEKINI